MLPTKEAPKPNPIEIIIPAQDGRPPYSRMEYDTDIFYLGFTPEQVAATSPDTIRDLAQWKMETDNNLLGC